jgi:glycogen phosphorylase
VNRTQSPVFDPSALTLGFARRAAAYKRANLIVSDLDRLRAVAAGAGRLQIVFAGKAHPHDEEGKRVIERVFAAREALRNDIAIAYLEDYDMTQAGVLTAGSDVWLNTPHPPLEASGTSGMKAALNGAESQRARRVVARGAHRRSDWLGHRRGRNTPSPTTHGQRRRRNSPL